MGARGQKEGKREVNKEKEWKEGGRGEREQENNEIKYHYTNY